MSRRSRTGYQRLGEGAGVAGAVSVPVGPREARSLSSELAGQDARLRRQVGAHVQQGCVERARQYFLREWWYAPERCSLRFVVMEALKVGIWGARIYGAVGSAMWLHCKTPAISSQTHCNYDYLALRFYELITIVAFAAVTFGLRRYRRRHEFEPNMQLSARLARELQTPFVMPDLVRESLDLVKAARENPITEEALAVLRAAPPLQRMRSYTQMGAGAAQTLVLLTDPVNDAIAKMQVSIERVNARMHLMSRRGDELMDVKSRGSCFSTLHTLTAGGVFGFLGFIQGLGFLLMYASLSKDNQYDWVSNQLAHMNWAAWGTVFLSTLGMMMVEMDDLAIQIQDMLRKVLGQFSVACRGYEVESLAYQQAVNNAHTILAELPELYAQVPQVVALKHRLVKSRPGELTVVPEEIKAETGLLSVRSHRRLSETPGMKAGSS